MIQKRPYESSLLGIRIKKARQAKNLTGERLAELLNINPVYLRQLESGSKTPSLPMFVELCNALQVSPSYFLYDHINASMHPDIDGLYELCHKATPRDLQIIYSLVSSALESIRMIDSEEQSTE